MKQQSLYENLRERWISRIVGKEAFAEAALQERALASVIEMPKLQPDKDSDHITPFFRHIRELAIAYQSSFFKETYHNPKIFQAAYDRLKYMSPYYAADMEMWGNWWHYDIGGAQALIDCLIFLRDEIEELGDEALIRHYIDALHYFIPVAQKAKRVDDSYLPMTGANLMDTSIVCALRAVLEENDRELEEVKEAAISVLAYVTEGDGFYRDGSYIQHHFIPYAGGYGPDLLRSFENIVYLLGGTKFAVNTNEAFLRVDSWIHDTWLPFLRDGEMMDMMRGRKTSRQGEYAHDTGWDVLGVLLLLSEHLPQEKRKAAQEEIKGQMLRSLHGKTFQKDAMRGYQKESITRLLETETAAAPQKEFYRSYGNMDRVTAQRKEYAVGISMFSSRIGRFSFGNGENRHGMHACEGAVYLFTDDAQQYEDNFWPTVDHMRFAGITTDHTTTELVPWKDNRNTRDWVGGSSLLNRYGSTGMELELEKQESDLTAKKSWFFFEEGMVCLGAGISASYGNDVETIVENRRTDVNLLTVDGEKVCLTDGRKQKRTAEWITLESEYLPIGYYFPEQQPLELLFETREGCWKDLNDGGSKEKIKRSFLSIAISHGVNPSQASYSYVLAPGKDEKRMKQLAKDRIFTIIANTDEVQAAAETTSGLTGINFWKAGRVSRVQAEQPCSITLLEKEGRLSLGIADPTHKTALLTIILDGIYDMEEADSTVSISVQDKTTRIKVCADDFSGKTHYCTLNCNR